MKSLYAALISIVALVLVCGNSTAETFTKISESGFGDRHNRYAWSMCAFTPDEGGDSGITFLYVGTWNKKFLKGGEIHRMEIVSEKWEPVITNGFGNPLNQGIRAMTVYENEYGKALYAGTVNWAKGTQIYRTFDGINWESVSLLKMGTRAFRSCSAARSLAVINGDLYMGTINDSKIIAEEPYLFRFREKKTDFGNLDKKLSWEAVIKPADDFIGRDQKGFASIFQYTDQHGVERIYVATWNGAKGAHLLASETGDSGTWTVVMNNGFGKNVGAIFDSMEHDGYIYLGTGAWKHGFNLFRSNDPSNSDSWEQIGEDNFGAGDYSKYAWTLLKRSDGAMYLTTNVFQLKAPAEFEGAQIYKSSDGLGWTQIVGADADVGPGFDDSENSGIRTSVEVDGVLYFGAIVSPENWTVSHGCEIWKMTD